jgi:hypothetical protein
LHLKGNWSLVEKAVAAESVVLAAAVVKKAGKGLTTLPPEHVPALDAFIGRTVDTSGATHIDHPFKVRLLHNHMSYANCYGRSRQLLHFTA